MVKEEYPVIKVRLKPDWVYRLPMGSTSIRGYGKPNKRLFVIPEDENQYYKLLHPYLQKEGEKLEIAIYNPEQKDLEGKLFEIVDKKTNQRDMFLLLKKDGQDCYRLNQPLSHSYPKVGSRIYQVYSCETDEEGKYYLPMWLVGNGEIKCRIFFEEEEGKEVVIYAGENNRMDLYANVKK